MSSSRKRIVYLIGTYRKGQEVPKKDEVQWEELEEKQMIALKKKIPMGKIMKISISTLFIAKKMKKTKWKEIFPEDRQIWRARQEMRISHCGLMLWRYK